MKSWGSLEEETRTAMQSCAARVGLQNHLPRISDGYDGTKKPGSINPPVHRKAVAAARLGISNADPNMKTGRLRVPTSRRPDAALNPRTNPFLDRVEHQGMKAILVREMQDEAAKHWEVRRNEQIAWEFIREEQRKRASARSPERYLLEAGDAKSCDSGVDPFRPQSQPVDNFQEAAHILRTGLKVVNLPSVVTHASGDSRFRVPLPGPPGVAGWAVTRSGNTRIGNSDPTRRWQGTRQGLSTLEFRVHKGVYVPSAKEVEQLKLKRLQKPHATRMKERAAEHKLRQMILGKESWDSGPQTSTGGTSMSAAEMWTKLRKKKDALGQNQQQTSTAGGGDNAESPEQTDQRTRDPDTDGRSSEAHSEDRESDKVSGMSLMRVSSMGVGHMGVVDMVQATFQAQEIREAARRQEMMRDKHLAPLVRIGEDLYDAIEELNVHHPRGITLGPATLERPQFIPTDYKELAKGLTNSRHGEVTYHREWSASGPPANKRASAQKQQLIQDPNLRKFAQMLEGTAPHEDLPSSSDEGDAVEGRVTASSSTPDWDIEGADVDHDQLVTVLEGLGETVNEVPVWQRRVAYRLPEPSTQNTAHNFGLPSFRRPSLSSQIAELDSPRTMAWKAPNTPNARVHRLKQELHDAADAAESPACLLFAEPSNASDDDTAPHHKRTRFLHNMQARIEPSSGTLAEQNLIQDLRSSCTARRIQMSSTFLTEEQMHKNAMEQAVQRAAPTRDVHQIMNRRMQLMVDTCSSSLNLDLEPALTLGDVPQVLQCVGPQSDGVSSKRCIKHLELLQDAVCGRTVVALLTGLRSLTSLTLGSCSPAVFPAFAKHLALGQATALTRLSMHCPKSTPCVDAVSDLANALTFHASLVHLSLRSCNIGLMGISEVVKMLEHNTVLQFADLSHNPVSTTFSHSESRRPEPIVWEPLTINTSLRALDLSQCKLGDVEAASLASALESNRGLQTVTLSANHLTWKASSALSSLISSNIALNTLVLDNNPIGRWGVWRILRACCFNEHLQNLGMNNVHLNSLLPDVDLNVDLPNGTYTFDPMVQQHVDCVGKLSQVIKLHGAQCFQHVVVDGVSQPVTRTELLQLLESFHESEGTTMKVVISSERVPAPHVPHLSSNLFSTLLRTLSESCSDQWRLQLLQIIQNTAAISCSQAAAILGCFETQDVSKPLQLLLMSIHDVPNISVFETVAVEYADACGSSALDEAYEQLRCPSASSLAHNPSGHYKLDLTNQVHRIMAVKTRNADLACRSMQRSALATSRPVVCRNIALELPALHTIQVFDSLSEALFPASAASPDDTGSMGQCHTTRRMPTEGILSFDIAQNSLGCAPRRHGFISKQAKAAMERMQVLKEVVALGWQDSPFMPAEDSSCWRQNSTQALQLIALVAHVCTGSHSMTQAKANQLLDAEHEILAAHQRAAHELWKCEGTQVRPEPESTKLTEATQADLDSPTTPTTHRSAGIDLTHRPDPPVVATLVGTGSQAEAAMATSEEATAAEPSGDTHDNRVAQDSTCVHTGQMAARVAAFIRKYLASADHLVSPAEASVLLKIIPSWHAREEALFALQTSLMTHSCMPYLASVVHASSDSSTSIPSAPTAPADNPLVLQGLGPLATREESRSTVQCERFRTLQKIGTCMGWGRSGLCWWPLGVGPVKIVLDLSQPDELLQLNSICRFAIIATGSNTFNCRPLFREAYLQSEENTVHVPDVAQSLMRGVGQVPDLVATAVANGARTLSLTLLLDITRQHQQVAAASIIAAQWKGGSHRQHTAANRFPRSLCSPVTAARLRWEVAIQLIVGKRKVTLLRQKIRMLWDAHLSGIAATVCGHRSTLEAASAHVQSVKQVELAEIM